MENILFVIISIIILIFSVIVHELAHGFMADFLGDPTARLEGRLTLNPISHIDPIGSILMPLVTSLAGFTFGWAKPVPYNPYNLHNKRSGEFLIAIAGPSSNLLMAIIFGLVVRFMPIISTNTSFLSLASYIVLINIILAIFNLLPVPPLDGSKLLFSILPVQYSKARFYLERFGIIGVFLVTIVFWRLLEPVIIAIFQLMTGLSA